MRATGINGKLSRVLIATVKAIPANYRTMPWFLWQTPDNAVIFEFVAIAAGVIRAEEGVVQKLNIIQVI